MKRELSLCCGKHGKRREIIGGFRDSSGFAAENNAAGKWREKAGGSGAGDQFHWPRERTTNAPANVGGVVMGRWIGVMGWYSFNIKLKINMFS